MIIKIVMASTLLLLLSNCSTKEESQNEQMKHKIASSDLKTLRKEITMVSFDRIKSELERDDLRRRHALTLSENLISLSERIKDIPKDKIKNLNTPQDQKLYEEYAQQLTQNAQSIFTLAQNYELEKLPNELAKMKNTCKTCHKRFKAKK